jgi:hypothetical protein
MTYSMERSPIEDLILSHINDSIVSANNIANILQAKNSQKLIRAADADYMNKSVYNKFAKTWAQRENVNTDTASIVKQYKYKMQLLYQNAQMHFGYLS